MKNRDLLFEECENVKKELALVKIQANKFHNENFIELQRKQNNDFNQK